VDESRKPHPCDHRLLPPPPPNRRRHRCCCCCCRSDGEINISADGTGSISCPTGGGSNSSFGGLLLFKWPQGAAFNPAATPIANTSSDPSASLVYRAPCRSGDNFRLCETGNLFLTDSVVFGFLGLYPRACPAKCRQVPGQCTPKQVLNPFKEKEGKMVTASQKHDSSSSSEAVMMTQDQNEGTPTIVVRYCVYPQQCCSWHSMQLVPLARLWIGA
jgi:hypothetical protein